MQRTGSGCFTARTSAADAGRILLGNEKLQPLLCLFGSGSGSCNASHQQKFPSVIHKELPPSLRWSWFFGSMLLIKQNLAILIRWEVLQKTEACEKIMRSFKKKSFLALSVHGNIISSILMRGKKHRLGASVCSENMVMLLTRNKLRV